MFLVAHSQYPKSGKNTMTINGRMPKQNVVYAHNRIIFSNEKEWGIDTCYNMMNPENIMLNERSQSQKVTYCMIPFIWNA